MDTENPVGGQESGEQGNEPTKPQFSDSSGDSVSLDANTIVSTINEAIEKKFSELDLDKLVSQKVQSVKDKRFSKIDEIDSKLKMLAELQQSGVQIPKEMFDSARLDAIEKMVSAKPEDNGMSQADAVAKADKILKKFGIDGNDPEVTKLWSSKKYPNNAGGYAQMLEDVTDLASRKVAQPNPTPATTPASTGSPSPRGTSEEELIAELSELQKNPSANYERIKEAEKKLGW